jgi:pathogenesis-related protein 1
MLILKEHNEARAEVGVLPVEWSCTLADFAQEWADQGGIEHSSNARLSNISTVPGIKAGENMQWDSRTKQPPRVKSWLDEKTFWDNTTTCRPGKMCGHYTQVVWRNTTQVGCGINHNASGRFKTVFVCNYNPGGNFPGSAY